MPKQKVVEPTLADKIRQDIINVCAQIGDKTFGIQQAEKDVKAFYARIDELRAQLGAAENADVSQKSK